MLKVIGRVFGSGFFALGLILGASAAYGEKIKLKQYLEKGDLVVTSSPALGETATARIGDLMYEEMAQPFQNALVLDEELMITGETPVVFPSGSVLPVHKLEGEQIYCYSHNYTKIALDISRDGHCFWDTDADGAVDTYQLLNLEDGTLRNTTKIDPFAGTLSLVPVKLHIELQSHDLVDVKGFSLFSVAPDRIELIFPEQFFSSHLELVFANSPSTMKQYGIGTGDTHIVNLKYKGETPVTYIIDGLEITLLDVKENEITYRIDKQYKEWADVAKDGSAYTVKLRKIKKAKRKK